MIGVLDDLAGADFSLILISSKQFEFLHISSGINASITGNVEIQRARTTHIISSYKGEGFWMFFALILVGKWAALSHNKWYSERKGMNQVKKTTQERKNFIF